MPGTKRVARVEENTAADSIELSAEQVERLNNLTPAAGERHDAGNMAVIEAYRKKFEQQSVLWESARVCVAA